MISRPKSDFNVEELEEKMDLRKTVFKYLAFWKYFLVSFFVCVFLAFIYNRYTTRIYDTSAKIKILDRAASTFDLPSTTDLFSSPKINLENEMEVLKSYSILEQVVRRQNLTTIVEKAGNIKRRRLVSHPFTINTKISMDSIF